MLAGRVSFLSELKSFLAWQWREHASYDGFTKESEEVSWFWRYVTELRYAERAMLFEWATGLRCLPHGGFASLPRRFVLRQSSEPKGVTEAGRPTNFPTVSTCFFIVSLPRYSPFPLPYLYPGVDQDNLNKLPQLPGLTACTGRRYPSYEELCAKFNRAANESLFGLA